MSDEPRVDHRLGALVWFGVDGQPEQASERYRALANLFEHDYDPTIKFWYGVATVECDVKQVLNLKSKCPATDFVFFILLPDRRGGSARVLDAKVYDEDNLQIAFVGVSGLSARDH
jgi:hypothetical protein